MKCKKIINKIYLSFLFMVMGFLLIPIHSNAYNSSQIMVSLGDSYSSGEGVEPFYGQEDAPGKKIENEDWVTHRSQNSWPGKLKLPGNTKKNSDLKNSKWFFAAASGAKTQHMDLKNLEEDEQLKKRGMLCV